MRHGILSRLMSAGGRAVGLGAALAAGLGALGCIEPVEVAHAPQATTLGLGQTRSVELRFRRLDVAGFEQTLTLADLRALPKAVLDDVWLLDLPLIGFSRSALEQLAGLTPAEVYDEPQPVQNMVTLLNLTPDNVVFEGTRLEDLIALSRSIGKPPARALAQILQIDTNARIIPLDVAADVMVEGLISTHPNGQTRKGPIDAAHPDGIYPVTPGAIPVSLGDVVDNFARLTERFGPAALPDGTMHPGFIVEADGFSVVEDAFRMTVRVNANALPYKGLDLTTLSVENVNSLASQVDSLFATDDPDWLRIEGLVPRPTIRTVTVRVSEEPTFVPVGTLRDPAPLGNAPVALLKPWRFERLVAEMARRTSALLVAHCTTFTFGAGTRVFDACTDNVGWTTFETFNDAGNPPPPAYLWDIQQELAQVRLHDGANGVRLPEGGADVQFTITDVDLGLSADEVVADTRRNLEANPRLLRGFANAVSDNSTGAPDLYYYHSADGRDWLYFIAPADVPRGDDGAYVRNTDYPKPGFFADVGLIERLSSTAAIEGDDLHDKVEIREGTTVYCADDVGAVYALRGAGKPSRNRIRLDVTRVR